MTRLSIHNAIILAVALSVVMWATRGHHVASLTHLPDASWAIFFLAGFYFRSRMVLPLFLAQAALMDYLAINLGVDSYCVTSAYAFLLPAYASMWLAGRWYFTRYKFHARTLATLAVAATTGAAACEIISSGSFYFLGGKFADTSMIEFAGRLARYFPFDLASAVLYLGAAALVHALIVIVQHSAAAHQ